jgi:hypothetical protein
MNYCPLCGAILNKSAVRSAHERLEAIEKKLIYGLIGVIALLLLVSWLALQAYHFGKGGFLG